MAFAELPLPGDTRWRPAETASLNFGFDDSRYWLRFALHNPHDRVVRLIYDVHQPLHDYVSVHVVADGTERAQWQTGDRRPLARRPIPYRAFAFPLTVRPGETVVVYTRLATHDGLYDVLPLRLGSERAFFLRRAAQSLSHGFFYGAVFILLIYNLVIGAGARERVMLVYALHLGVYLVWNLAFRGYLAIWPLADHPVLHNLAINVSGAAVLATMALFTHQFLNLGQELPRTGKVVLGIGAAMLIPLVVALFGYYAPVIKMFVPLIFLLIVVMLGVGVYLAWRGQVMARIFLLAWGILLLTLTGHFARLLEWLPADWVAENTGNLGALIQMLVFSLALSWRMKDLKLQRLQAQQRLIRRERQMNVELQQRVEEQTRELKTLAAHLEHESVTDSLTGLLNRRTFDHTLDRELARLPRTGQILGLAMLDIDHFKRFNDVFGHTEGDNILRAIAGLMQQYWQRTSDYCYRLGGEEFGVLFHSNRNLEGMHANIEAFRAAVRELALPDSAMAATGAPEYITISAGVALIGPDARVDAADIYKCADDALYSAKEHGRDRTCYAHIRNGQLPDGYTPEPRPGLLGLTEPPD